MPRGRKPKVLSAALESEIDARIAQGQSAATIAKALGQPALERTIGRRKAKSVPIASQEVAPDDVPEAIPEGVDLGTVDKWIKRIEKAAEAAEQRKDFTAMASLMAKLVALLEHKRKATPLPKTDPNELPDMVALADTAIERLHKIARELKA